MKLFQTQLFWYVLSIRHKVICVRMRDCLREVLEKQQFQMIKVRILGRLCYKQIVCRSQRQKFCWIWVWLFPKVVVLCVAAKEAEG